MGTPLGDFIRAKRQATMPAAIDNSGPALRRTPGLRRGELAARAQISPEYLTRIEQGRDRNPTSSVVNSLADALGLATDERQHLTYLAKITGGACATQNHPRPPRRDVRASVVRTLRMLEPGVAVLTNRLGDLLAYTEAFGDLMRPTGILDAESPNLTRYVFTDPRAGEVFPDWDRLADERAFDLWLGPSAAEVQWFTAELTPNAGTAFTERLSRTVPPARTPFRIRRSDGAVHAFDREVLELPEPDNQQIVVFHPVDGD